MWRGTQLTYEPDKENIDPINNKESRGKKRKGQCDLAATKQKHLKKHKPGHEEIKYTCDQCEYVANSPSKLKNHRTSKHEGITYPCG